MAYECQSASVFKSRLAGGASEMVLCYFLFRGQNFHQIKLQGHMDEQVQSCFSSLGIDKSTSSGLPWVTVPYGWWQVQAHPPLIWLILLSRRVLTGRATMPSRTSLSITMKDLEIFHYTVQLEFFYGWTILAVLLYLVLICLTHGHSFLASPV